MLTRVLTGNLTFTSLKPLDLSKCTKQQIKEYFENSYDLNESLFTSLKDESVLYKCPDRLRLPLVFYFAHTAVVYTNKLMLAGLMKERVNLAFETMFETGVDEMSWDDTENYRMGGSYKWPSLDEIVEYRRNVRNIIMQVIDSTPLEHPITMESPWWALVMGMEHERIHLETSSVLIRQLPVDMVTKPEGWTYGPVKHGESILANPFIRVKGQEVTVGKPEDFPSYGWDNEYGEVKCFVPPFEASKYLITNWEFMDFVNAGGYDNKVYWTNEGWQWKEFRKANHPTFWVCNQGCKGGCGADLSSYSHCHLPDLDLNGVSGINSSSNGINGNSNGTSGNRSETQYMYRAMFDIINMPMDWPVEVNYHEAKAFCAWKGSDYRLPSEAEHHVMRGSQKPMSMGTACDIIFNNIIEANFNLQFGSSTPVNLYPPTETGFHDVFGNVWQWVEDHFNGLSGFNTHWLYDDFSSPCFDGKHNVILGGAWISTGDEASRFARFSFRRHFFQHLGFRVARTIREKDENVKLPVRVIDSEIYVLGVGVQEPDVYLDEENLAVEKVPTTNAHYGFDTEKVLKGILELEFGFRDNFAAVLGNLSGCYAQVFRTGINSAMHLGSGAGRSAFEMSTYFNYVLGVECGARFVDAALHLQKNLSLSYVYQDGESEDINIEDNNYNMERIVFKQMTWVPNEVDSHDLVLVSHLERVQNPKAWLVRLWEVTKPTGIAVIASSEGTWGPSKLNPILGERMKCVSTQEIPYEGPKGETVSMVTVWKCK